MKKITIKELLEYLKYNDYDFLNSYCKHIYLKNKSVYGSYKTKSYIKDMIQDICDVVYLSKDNERNLHLSINRKSGEVSSIKISEDDISLEYSIIVKTLREIKIDELWT